MHFEQQKQDQSHYHHTIELRDDAGQLAATAQAGISGISLIPETGWRITAANQDRDGIHITVRRAQPGEPHQSQASE